MSTTRCPKCGGPALLFPEGPRCTKCGSAEPAPTPVLAEVVEAAAPPPKSGEWKTVFCPHCPHQEDVRLPISSPTIECPQCHGAIPLQPVVAQPAKTPAAPQPAPPATEVAAIHVAPQSINPYASPSATGPSPKAIQDGRPIGGALILFAIGLIVSPIISFRSISLSLQILFTDEGRLLQQRLPGLGYLALVECALRVAFILFLLFAIVCFFLRKRFVPGMLVLVCMTNIALTLLLTIWATQIIKKFEPEHAMQIIRSFIPAVIWITYFTLSDRVRKTFVK